MALPQTLGYNYCYIGPPTVVTKIASLVKCFYQ